VLLDEHIASDYPLPPLPDFHQLGGQSGHEVLQPPGHVHGGFQETARPLNPRQRFGDAVRDRGESRMERGHHVISPLFIAKVATPNRAATSS